MQLAALDLLITTDAAPPDPSAFPTGGGTDFADVLELLTQPTSSLPEAVPADQLLIDELTVAPTVREGEPTDIPPLERLLAQPDDALPAPAPEDFGTALDFDFDDFDLYADPPTDLAEDDLANAGHSYPELGIYEELEPAEPADSGEQLHHDLLLQRNPTEAAQGVQVESRTTVDAPNQPARAPDPIDRALRPLPDFAPDPDPVRTVRVAADADLMLELRTDHQRIDVVLEGRVDALQPLLDARAELGAELEDSGYELGDLSGREAPDEGDDDEHEGPDWSRWIEAAEEADARPQPV